MEIFKAQVYSRKKLAARHKARQKGSAVTIGFPEIGVNYAAPLSSVITVISGKIPTRPG